MCFSPQRRATFQHLNFKKWSETLSFLTFWLGNVLLATTACNFSTSQLQKVLRTWHFDLKMCFSPQRRAICSTSELQKVVWDPQIFNILTWKCASRHSGVQFFNISTSKSAPNLTFWLENVLLATTACNVQHLNFKKWSETLRFLTFWLGNVLLATAACNFSTSQLQKVLRTWHFDLKMCFSPQRRAICSTSELQKVVWDPQIFNILTWKCASRHSGVQFFNISTSKSAPNLTFWLENVLLATTACNLFNIWTSKSGLRPSDF